MNKRYILMIIPYDMDEFFIEGSYDTVKEAEQAWHKFMGSADISETYQHAIWDQELLKDQE